MSNEESKRPFQTGDRVKVEHEGEVVRVDTSVDLLFVRTEGNGHIYAKPEELTLIEPAYVEPELRPGDTVAAIGEPDDTACWYLFVPSLKPTPFFSSMGRGVYYRNELPERIRILPPLRGSREAELAARVERALGIAEFYGGPVARDIVKILRGEA